MTPSVYYALNCIADGITDLLIRTPLFNEHWIDWTRPLTKPWIYFT